MRSDCTKVSDLRSAIEAVLPFAEAEVGMLTRGLGQWHSDAQKAQHGQQIIERSYLLMDRKVPKAGLYSLLEALLPFAEAEIEMLHQMDETEKAQYAKEAIEEAKRLIAKKSRLMVKIEQLTLAQTHA
jgi:hypothetical protein